METGFATVQYSIATLFTLGLLTPPCVLHPLSSSHSPVRATSLISHSNNEVYCTLGRDDDTFSGIL
jgi:hypothetical protein